MTAALNVAKYALNFCNDNNIEITNLKLQFVLYFAMIEHLKRYDRPLFRDNIVCEKFGPCVNDVYYHYCGFGPYDIWLDYDGKQLDLTDQQKRTIRYVTYKVSLKDIWTLTEVVTKPGTIWHEVFNNLSNVDIMFTQDLIHAEDVKQALL